MATVMVARLYAMQISGGEEARNIIESRLTLSVQLPAQRGDITDRYGRTMVTSKTGYRVDMHKTDAQVGDLCQEILTAFSLLSPREKKLYTDAVPISFEAPYTFEETDSAKVFQKERKLSAETSAEDAIQSLCTDFGVADTYSLPEKRILCGVFYGMKQEGFSVAYPYTLAETVEDETVMRFLEQAHRMPSVSVYAYPVREYLYPETAVHLLGRVGKISSEEYQSKQAEGYRKTDLIGKQGVEKAFETILRGTDGIKALFTDTNYVTPQEPIPGDTIMLTLDLDLQQATEQALERAVSRTQGSEENGAAAVVLDVHSGEILASASYPDYDITTFSKAYHALSQNPAKPMFHRSLAGLYAPGSTFKPISAIAALEKGVVQPEDVIETRGEYAYLDQVFRCNIFRTKGETHGKICLAEALGVSCNYFFYDLATKTGSDAISKTANAFGLGNKTGSELSFEEREGRVASEENRKNSGGTWYPGDVLQAAIGQSDHMFTPIQLANYAAAIANGGTLYRTGILKAVKSIENGRMIPASNKEILCKTEVSAKALSVVQEGMELVTKEGGTAGEVFADFPIDVAGKTGSAQVPGGTNGLFIGYAPADHPQIALCTVIENGGAGSLAAAAAKDIFSAYFAKTAPVSSQEDMPYTIQP